MRFEQHGEPNKRMLASPSPSAFALFETCWSPGWGSQASDFEVLTKYFAYGIVDEVLTEALLNKIQKRTQFLSLGIDIIDIFSDIHAELVALVDVRSKNVRPENVHWTGKSYPMPLQEHKLIHAPLESHKCICNGERILVLGCHDLNMFSERSYKSQKLGSNKRRITDEMRKITHSFNPTVVLHHPHTTYSPNIWRVPWAGVKKHLPNASTWASGIAFCGKKEQAEQKWNCSQTLDKTLSATKFGNVCDLKVDGHECEIEQKWLDWAKRHCYGAEQ